jgi:hypothetical protein
MIVDAAYFRITCPSSKRAAGEDLPFLCEVRPNSPFYLREMVEKIAYYFLRELNYDFAQFSSYDQTEYWAYLFLEDGIGTHGKVRIAVGACCFRRRDWEDKSMPSEYGLQWVWIHPYRRNWGYLKWAWPRLVKKFGDFMPEPPFSKGAAGFLRKYGTVRQKEILMRTGLISGEESSKAMSPGEEHCPEGYFPWDEIPDEIDSAID